MSIGVFFVSFPCGQLYSDNHNNAAENIGCGVNSVAYHGAGMGENACQELQKGYMFHDTVLRHSMVGVAQ